MQNDFPLNDMAPLELLALHARITRTLIEKEVLRSSNNPVADYAEFLACAALGLTLANKSAKGHDAFAADGTRYEVKARRPIQKSGARQLSALRKLDEKHFDFLVGIIFNEDFTVDRACVVPQGIVEREASFIAHTNSWRFMLTDEIWEISSVKDVTQSFRQAQSEAK